jgi:uncharacterized protein YukE
MERENEYLKDKIKELIKAIEDFGNQINIGNGQLSKLKQLLDEANRELEEQKKKCEDQDDYYKRETARRTSELKTVGNAKDIFENILQKLSARVKDRAANIHAGAEAGSDLSKNVVKAEAGHSGDVSKRQGEREQVVF